MTLPAALLRYGADDRLMIEECPAHRLAEAFDTPLYVYSAGLMRRRLAELRAALPPALAPKMRIAYAVKANSNQAVLRLFQQLGCGADLVTGGELARALAAGFDPSLLVFSGLGKSDADLTAAIQHQVGQINVESLSELSRAQAMAAAAGTRARIAFRLNPQMEQPSRDAQASITTGKPDSKFGIPWPAIAALLPGMAETHPNLTPVGVSVHIGSNMAGEDLQDFATVFRWLRDQVLPVLRQHLPGGIILDLGGGLGAGPAWDAAGRDSPTNPHLPLFSRLLHEGWGDLATDPRLSFVIEPGRLLVAEAGVLLTRVLHVKEETALSPGQGDTPRQSPGDWSHADDPAGDHRHPGPRPTGSGRGGVDLDPLRTRFAIVDAAMNDLLRPMLYGSWHPILPARRQAEAPLVPVDVCGPVCESTDSFMRPTAAVLGLGRTRLTAAEVPGLPDAARFLMPDEVAPGFLTTADGGRHYAWLVRRRLPALQRGDLLAIMGAGAYGAVMASEYNTRPLVAEALVDGARMALIRPRPSVAELIARDAVPLWFG